MTATFRTDEFGVPTASAGASGQPFGFTGEPRDASGLSYLRARYYDPDLARFLCRDTWPGSVDAPQTLDRYAYVANNPATYSDPSGLVGPGGSSGPRASRRRSRAAERRTGRSPQQARSVGLGT